METEPRNPRRYDPAVAEWIAERFADGASLRDLHRAHPDRIPAPLYVRRWREDVPAFDLLMREAERARAEGLVEDAIDASRDRTIDAASARVAAQTALQVAQSFDRARFGQQVAHSHAHSMHGGDAPLTRAQLLDIVRQGIASGAVRLIASDGRIIEHEGRTDVAREPARIGGPDTGGTPPQGKTGPPGRGAG